jgi:predicted regulator of Ras-like GTPase activity (Roadblock/LC7/MglB family)
VLLQVHAKRVALTLRREITGVRRVLLARTDGLPFHDEVVDETVPATDQESASAVVAAMLGLAEYVSATSRHGELGSAIVRSAEGCLVVYRAGAYHVLAIYAEPSVNLVLLDRLARKLVGDLEAA